MPRRPNLRGVRARDLGKSHALIQRSAPGDDLQHPAIARLGEVREQKSGRCEAVEHHERLVGLTVR